MRLIPRGKPAIAVSDEFLQHIDEIFSLLLAKPEMGRKRPELGKLFLRSFPIDAYAAFCDIVPEGILIIRVLHSARDLENLF